jgi:hypothetical protein
MPNLQELLNFRGQALSQFVLVATILGAFSMSGVIALIATHERARLRSSVFVLLAAASLAFILATLISVLILPFMTGHAALPDKSIRGLLFLYSVVVFSIITGTLLLVAGLAGAGFMVSRRVGQWTVAAVIAATLIYIVCVVHLVSIFR